jgi:uncharacterized protein YciI
MSTRTKSPDENLSEIARLEARMLKKVYFVMSRVPVAPEKIDGALLDHLRWIIALEKSGAVLLSGPLSERSGRRGAGMTVFIAKSWDEAEFHAKSDPLYGCGAVDFELSEWTINEGRISLSLDLSDQTYRLA